MKEDNNKGRTYLVNGPTKTTTGIVPSILKMVGGRRGRSCAPTIFFILVIILGGYGYFLYNELTTRCTDTEGKLSFVMKKQSSLKSQLQVVYEHRTKLEAALLKERKDHRKTKHDFVNKMKECSANLTTVKHEGMTRFHALDTEHKMLKAKHEEVTSDYANMQQQYVRLTEDHQKIVNGQKEDFERLKDTKEKESKSLQERVETLYTEKEEQKSQVSKYLGYYQSERNERVKLAEASEKNREQITELQEKAVLMENERNEFKGKFNLAESKIHALETKIRELNTVIKEQEKQAALRRHEVRLTEQEPTKPLTVVTLKHERKSETQTSSKRFEKKHKRSSRHKVITEAPTNKHAVRTTNKLTKNTVKSKILGRHTKKHGRRSKPSDKVQHILLGKKENVEEVKKEDSIKDQFEVYESQERGKLQILEHPKKQLMPIKPAMEFTGAKDTLVRQIVTRPVSSDHIEQKESKRLVDSKKEINEDDVKIRRSPSVSDSLSSLGNALDEKIDNVDREKENMLPNGLKDNKDKINESVGLRKDRLSQYSKIKADGQQGDTNTHHKESDAGNTFVRRQQQLMHRSQLTQNGAEREETGKQNLGSEEISEKEVNENGDTKQAAFESEGKNTRSDAIMKSKDQRENNGGNGVGAGDRQRANQIRPPNSRKSKQEVDIAGNAKAEKQDVGDTRNSENVVQSVGQRDVLKPAKNGPQIQAPIRRSQVEKQANIEENQKNVNQLHAPLKKPKQLKEETNIYDNPKTGHDEDERGDQDLDVQKVNEEHHEPSEMDEDRGANEKENEDRGANEKELTNDAPEGN